MNERDRRFLLLALGIGLIIGGHRLTDAEFGKLGIPHAAGAAVIALALRV